MRPLPIIAAAAVAMFAAPAMAQDAERYQLERTDDGYVRLDTVTGKMSICQERGGRLVCNVAAEEREAYDREFDSLQDRIEALEDRIAALETSGAADRLPSDEEFEQTMGYMEKFFRRFMGIVKDLDKDSGGPNEPRPEADRT